MTLETFRTEFDLDNGTDAVTHLGTLLRMTSGDQRTAVMDTHTRNLSFYGNEHIASIHTLYAFYRGMV